ncbi:MAG: aminotransferase class I/II-fold pyridoxal phosphate-dependent enzyme [Oscillospiraceae bacterium]|jgi:arginine/lysine/ornithine decarboxylase|nr:aminotransferase class I/II-fold pyridoxal phosphate-dependent enzyme [Oscillospiraceae bacterium]
MDGYTTLFSALEQLSNSRAVTLHMPGHKRNAAGVQFLEKLGAAYDITELEGFDNLHEPRGILKEAERRAAALWGSQRCFFLVNGSTGGILAAVRALSLATGSDRLIMARNCHRSVYNAAQLCALKTIYIAAPTAENLGFSGSITPESVEAAVRLAPGAPVILTSPTYEGIVSNIADIAIICHMYGCPLIVDSAHGAHFGLSRAFPAGAVKAGADIVIQSVHKTLAGLTQTAILHLNSALVTAAELQTQLGIFQTSSPSYPLMASIDGTVALIEKRGKQLFGDWEARLDRFDAAASALRSLKTPGHGELFECQLRRGTPGYRVKGLAPNSVWDFDRSKIIIDCTKAGISGIELSRLLRERFGIYCETASRGFCIAMTGLLDCDENTLALTRALRALDDELSSGEYTHTGLPSKPTGGTSTTKSVSHRTESGNGVQFPTELPTRRMEALEALHTPREAVPLEACVGRVAAEYVWRYPPGVALLVPGEEISEELLSALLLGRAAEEPISGSAGSLPEKITVVKTQ